METIELLRRKIRTAGELQSVVKTMKALAAVNIRHYERAVESLTDYSRTIELGFQILLRSHAEFLAGPSEDAGGPVGAIVFGSDQGMCGQFNSEIAWHARRALGQIARADKGPLILAVGTRLAGHLEAAEVYPLPSSVAGITDRVQDVVLLIERWRVEDGICRVVLFHHRPLSGASYDRRTVNLLPIDPQWLNALKEKDWPTRMLPTFFIDWQPMLASLVRQYLFIWLYRAFAESLAAENAARLASMQAAEKNIDERLEALNRRYHRQRQTLITEELLDVISGFEVLSHP